MPPPRSVLPTNSWDNIGMARLLATFFAVTAVLAAQTAVATFGLGRTGLKHPLQVFCKKEVLW